MFSLLYGICVSVPKKIGISIFGYMFVVVYTLGGGNGGGIPGFFDNEFFHDLFPWWSKDKEENAIQFIDESFYEARKFHKAVLEPESKVREFFDIKVVPQDPTTRNFEEIMSYSILHWFLHVSTDVNTEQGQQLEKWINDETSEVCPGFPGVTDYKDGRVLRNCLNEDSMWVDFLRRYKNGDYIYPERCGYLTSLLHPDAKAGLIVFELARIVSRLELLNAFKHAESFHSYNDRYFDLETRDSFKALNCLYTAQTDFVASTFFVRVTEYSMDSGKLGDSTYLYGMRGFAIMFRADILEKNTEEEIMACSPIFSLQEIKDLTPLGYQEFDLFGKFGKRIGNSIG